MPVNVGPVGIPIKQKQGVPLPDTEVQADLVTGSEAGDVGSRCGGLAMVIETIARSGRLEIIKASQV